MAIRPVRTSSIMPNGRISSMKDSIFRSWPEISIIIISGATSTIRPRKMSTSSRISLRWAGGALTFINIRSRSTKSCELMSSTRTTVTIFSSCLRTWSRTLSSPTTTKVICDSLGFSVSPTARLSML